MFAKEKLRKIMPFTKITGSYDPENCVIRFHGGPEYTTYTVEFSINNVQLRFPYSLAPISLERDSQSPPDDKHAYMLDTRRGTLFPINSLVQPGTCVLDIKGHNGIVTEEGHFRNEFPIDQDGIDALLVHLDAKPAPEEPEQYGQKFKVTMVVCAVVAIVIAATLFCIYKHLSQPGNKNPIAVSDTASLQALTSIVSNIPSGTASVMAGVSTGGAAVSPQSGSWASASSNSMTTAGPATPAVTNNPVPAPAQNQATATAMAQLLITNGGSDTAIPTNMFVVISGKQRVYMPMAAIEDHDRRTLIINNGGIIGNGINTIYPATESTARKNNPTSVERKVSGTKTDVITESCSRNGCLPPYIPNNDINQVNWSDTIQPGETPVYYFFRPGWKVLVFFDKAFVRVSLIDPNPNVLDNGAPLCKGYKVCLRQQNGSKKVIVFIATRISLPDGNN